MWAQFTDTKGVGAYTWIIRIILDSCQRLLYCARSRTSVRLTNNIGIFKVLLDEEFYKTGKITYLNNFRNKHYSYDSPILYEFLYIILKLGQRKQIKVYDLLRKLAKYKVFSFIFNRKYFKQIGVFSN